MFARILIAILIVTCAGCSGSEGGGDPEGECDDLLLAARVALENEFYRLSQADSVEHPTDIDFRAAASAYQDAVDGCGDDSEALFGLGVSSLFTVTQDPEVIATFDRWDAFADTASIFEQEVTAAPSASRSVPPLASGRPFELSSPAIDAAGLVRVMVSLPLMAFVEPPQIDELQDLIEDEALPRLVTAGETLESVAADPAFRFTVTPKMQGDLDADPLELDRTEVYASLAAASVLEAIGNLVTAYDLNFATYDSAGLAEALAQSSSFLSLRTGGAARMGLVRTSLLDAADQVDDGIDVLEGETDSQHDDIIVIDESGGDDGPTQSDLDSIRTALDDIRAALNGPREVEVDIDGDGIDDVFTVDLEAFLTDPPSNLKSLLPPYTVEVIGESQAGGGARLLASEDLCPVITWDALTFEAWIFPDPTMHGLLPGMTDAELKELIGVDAKTWTRRNELCDAPEPVTITGVVYSDYPGGPVEGAIVSTSIDDVTAVTDVDGAFTLETDVRGDYCCDPYTISVSALDYQFWSESAIWGQDADVKVVLTYQYGARRTARVANR